MHKGPSLSFALRRAEPLWAEAQASAVYTHQGASQAAYAVWMQRHCHSNVVCELLDALGTCYRPIPVQLSQDLHFNKIPDALHTPEIGNYGPNLAPSLFL